MKWLHQAIDWMSWIWTPEPEDQDTELADYISIQSLELAGANRVYGHDWATGVQYGTGTPDEEFPA